MGKQRRHRQKLHLSAKPKQPQAISTNISDFVLDTTPFPLAPITDNIFEGIQIDIGNLNKKLPDDVQSIKSFKSLKSELGKTKILPKKDKLKLRREMFLKKIDMTSRLRKESIIRNKRKNIAIIGDTNPLRDALPSLESLLKSKTDAKCNKQSQQNDKKSKGIEKLSKQKKKHVQGVNIYKQLLKNKSFQKNTLGTISDHVKAIVEREREFVQVQKK